MEFSSLKLCKSLTTLLPIVVLAAFGCDSGDRTPPIIDLGGAPLAETLDLTFDIFVESQPDDTGLVEIWVETSMPGLWSRLHSDPDDSAWQRLIVVRPLDSAPLEADGAGATPDAPSTDAPSTSAINSTIGQLPGSCEIVGDRLRFRPLEPLEAGTAYRIEFHPSAIPGYDFPGAPPAIPVVAWHLHAVLGIEPDDSN